ncbi:S9 family peptidase [Telmatocola sphagniphila]|uniref:S9 family peptidase n=2 Tax=Telmatocola sphagniphila TaxID=1123043 RepID=A0A8E6F0J4_9BACT|nr:S9 family peptidase [Telmatocola sphagniphila]
MWYKVRASKDRYEFHLVDYKTGKKEPLFDREKLTAALAEIGAAKLKLDELSPDQFHLSEDRMSLKFPWNNQTLIYNRLDHSVSIAKPDKATAFQLEDSQPVHFQARKENPWKAYKEGTKLILEDREKKEKFELGSDDKETYYSGPYLFSPDFTKLVCVRVKLGEKHDVTVIESSPRTQLQPKVRILENYRKPGDAITILKPRLFDLATKKEIPISDKLFENPYDFEDRTLSWNSDSSQFTFEYNQRGHQVYRVLSVDAKTGAVRAIVNEETKTFFEYSGKKYIHWYDNKQKLLWMSERSGWNHLYRIDASTGSVLNPVTQGNWVVRSIVRTDDEKGQIWLNVGGIYPEQDPYYLHQIRVNYDGTGLVKLTEGDGSHFVTYSPDRKYILDRYSRVDMAPKTELRDAETGKLISVLETADDSDLKRMGWRSPERFVAKGRDGQTDIYGVVYRPMNFDPSKKYPVIENIYAGPQGAFVPKIFRAYDRKAEYAELGFIVVQIDGMGTSFRSKAFHDVCWKNLGDAGFPDRILWLKALAEKYPQVDLTRVGIFGGSAGGQNALGALLRHPDFYKVAVADCGCHDNRMDKIWWNELWMGWPVGKEYEEASNVVNAHKLQGKLLLTVGEIDSNVDPASTMQVVNALIKANKDFDMIVVPGGNHGVGETPYMNRRRMDFFVRHLLGVEPRAN